MKNDYKSRFRILKGGKISLVVSALLVNFAFATEFTTTQDGNTDYTLVNGDTISTTNADGIRNITGDASNIVVSGDITLGGTASVSGISFDNGADGSSITIEDTGSINVDTSYGGNAIYVDDTANNFTLNNSGELTADENAIEFGYGSNYDFTNLNITNKASGVITSSESGIYIHSNIAISNSTISNEGEINSEISGIVASLKSDSKILNSGTINSKQVGIETVLDFNSEVINSNIINITGDEKLSTAGIFSSEMKGDSIITNSGTINITSNAKYVNAGLGAITMNDNASIINSGTINITNAGNAENTDAGISIFSMFGNASITNTGTINSSRNGIEVFYTKYELNELENGKITNSGTINAAEYAIKIHDTSFDNFTITNETSGTLNGNIQAYGGNDNLLINKGKINLRINDSKTNPSEYEMVVNNFHQTASGILQIKVDNSADANNPKYSQVFVNQGLTLDDNTTIDFNVVSNPNENLLLGQTLENVIALDSNGTHSYNIEKLKVTDNSHLLDFEAISNQSYGLDFNIVHATDKNGNKETIENTVEEEDTNSKEMAKELDKLLESNSQFAALAGGKTKEQLNKLSKEATPNVAAALASSATQVQNTIGSVISGRQLGIRGIGGFTGQSGANSGDELSQSYQTWGKLFGTKAKQDDKDGFNGYEFDTYGFAVGADKEFGENKRFGLAFVYANGEIETNNVKQTSDLDIYNLVAYGSTPVFGKDTIFFYQASIGLQDTSTYREISEANTSARADFNGFLASASARLIKNIQVNNKLLVVPTLKAMYSYIKNPSYKESGADYGLNLHVNSFDTDTLKAGIGTDIEYKLKNDFVLLSNAMVHYDIIEGSNVSSYSLANTSSSTISVEGMDNKRWSYELGLGLKKELTEQSNLRIEYNYEGRDSSFSNQTLSLKYSWKF